MINRRLPSLPLPQLVVVYCQNRKMGGKRLVLEMIPVVVGLKPAVDAFRLASGAKIEEKQTFDPLAEMVRRVCLLYHDGGGGGSV